MKKLILGFTLTLFLGTFSVSAINRFDNPPVVKAKSDTTATTEKKCTKTTADKKACCADKATASTEKKCCKAKSTETASTAK